MEMVGNKSVEELFNDIKAEKLEGYIPVIVFVAVVIIVGLTGNTLTCLYYGSWHRHTASKRLIFSLAVTDAVMCVSMSTNFVDLRFVYETESWVFCKISYFLTHLIGLISICILVSIVVFRYQAVCKPFGTRFTLCHSNIAIIFSCVFAVLETGPTWFMYDSVPVNVTVAGNVTVVGYECAVSKQDDRRTLYTVINTIDGLIFVSALTTLMILYALIARYVLKHEKRLSVFTSVFTDGTKQQSIRNGPWIAGKRLIASVKKRRKQGPRDDSSVDDTLGAPTATAGDIEMETTGDRDGSVQSALQSGETELQEVESNGTTVFVGDGQPNTTRVTDSNTSNVPTRGDQKVTTDERKTNSKVTTVLESIRAAVKFKRMSTDSTTAILSTRGDQKVTTDRRSAISMVTEVPEVTTRANTSPKRFTKHNSSNKSKTGTLNRSGSVSTDSSSNYTMMTFVITLAFVFSFLPYFVMSVRDVFGDVNIDDDRATWVRFIKRSYLLNNAINPFIYGYYNADFRAFVRNIFTCKLNPCRKGLNGQNNRRV